jgi:hypothetical protein
MSLKQDIDGASALADWLGDGGHTVDPMIAEFRAARCVSGNNGDPCPHNKEPNWWDRVKHVVADWIRKQLELKEGMELRLSVEESLHMCAKCGCCLKLKVWVPTDHIRAITPEKTLQEMPDYCWIKRELKTS